jgi:hypothetical protein
MDCRTFRRQHLEYLDRTLPGETLVSMQEHAATCSCCARLDVSLRRGLMVARSLSVIQPSAGFADRLRERLAVQHRTALVMSTAVFRGELGSSRRAALR